MGQNSQPEVSANLVLIGGRGCGKSSIAKRIARSNRHFMLFSLDALIRYDAGGLTIPEIVEREGWRGFRRRERAVVRKVSVFERGAVIDAGGGVVVELDRAGNERFSEEKVAALRRHGRVVYLHRPYGFLRDHVGEDSNRPQLSSSEGFLEMMERRDPWYRRAAHHVIECGSRPKSDLSSQVLDWFYAHQEVREG